MMKPQLSVQKQRKTVSYQKHQVNKDSQLQRKQINKTRRIHSAKTITPQHPVQPVRTARTMNPSMPQLQQNCASSAPKLTAIPILANPQETQQLDYSYNKIVLIPQNISSLYVNLSILHLSHNEITSMQALCGLVQMRELYLDNNLVNFVPKEIKNLTKLKVLDLSYNKLWYVSQVAALNDLVTKRQEQNGQYLDLRLEGNSVTKTNEKALRKLLYHHPNNVKAQTNSKFTPTSATQLLHNKQNISPNSNKSPIATTKPSNHKKTRSLNQTLFDMSSIIANIPTTQTSTSIAPLSSIQQLKQKKQSISLLEKKLNMKEKSISLFMEQLKEHKAQSSPMHGNHPLVVITSYDDQFSPMSRSAKNLSYQQLFRQVSGFEMTILEVAMKQLMEVSDLERKLTLIQDIKTIPEVLKPQFSSMSTKVIQTATNLKELLQSFTSFYQQDHTQFSQKIEEFLNIKKPHPQIHSFHQRTLSYYLNSSETKEIKWYEVWMKQYDLFQKKLSSSEKLLKSYIEIWKKVHKLSRVGTLLCEPKNSKNAVEIQKQSCLNIYTQKKSTSRKQLNNLLFSQLHDKQNSLFSSGKKQSLLLSHRTTKSPQKSSPQPYRLKINQNCEDCLECPIKGQQIILLEQRLKKEQHKTLDLERTVKLLQEQIESLNQFRKFSDEIAIKQNEIISQIEVIKPSTYQNVLLTQALCIQDFIHGQQLYTNQEKIIEKNSPLNFNSFQTTHYGGNNITGTAIQTKKNKIKQSLYGKGHKIELHQFLLTEDSSKSNKNTYRQGTQRTYFKTNGTGNGTMPFSHSARSKIYSPATNNQQQRNSISSKGRPFEVETKLYTISQQQNSRDIIFINQVPKISGHSNNSPLIPKNDGKNGVFEKIVVGEFRNQKVVYNVDRQKIKNQKNNPSQIKNEMCEMTQLKKQKQTYPNSNLNLKGKNTDIDFQIGNNQKKFSSKTINPFKSSSTVNDPYTNSKTIPDPQAFCMKQLYSCGYKYDDIHFEQNQQYKNYIKHHLRNNIKQLLDKKYIDQEDDFCQIGRRVFKNDSKTKMEKNRTNKFTDSLTEMRCNRKIQKGQMKFLTQPKNKCHGKYIRKTLDNDGK